MAFPLNPSLGDIHTTTIGAHYIFQSPGVWKNVSSSDTDNFQTIFTGGVMDTPSVILGAGNTLQFINMGDFSYEGPSSTKLEYSTAQNTFIAGKNCTVGAGSDNFCTGFANHIEFGSWNTIFGESNTIQSGGNNATIQGGYNHILSGNRSAIGPVGFANNVSGQDSMATGVGLNVTGNNSYAWGVGGGTSNGSSSTAPTLLSGSSSFWLSANNTSTPGIGIASTGAAIIGGTSNDITANGNNSILLGLVGFSTDEADTTFVNKLQTLGSVRLRSYGSGTNTGTLTNFLAVDANGNVIETVGGFSATNGNGTTVNGTSIDLGGLMTGTILINAQNSHAFAIQDTTTFLITARLNAGSGGSAISGSSTATELYHIDNTLTKKTGFDIRSNGIKVYDQDANLGLFYDVDNSAVGILNDRWIPDYKAVTDYVDAAIAAGGGGGGASNFIALTDTPSTFTGQAGKYAVVNSGETALEFIDSPVSITYSKSFVLQAPNGSDHIPFHTFDAAVTITSIYVETNNGTVDLNLWYNSNNGFSNTGGSQIFTTDTTATTTRTKITSFSNSTPAADDALSIDVSSATDATYVLVTVNFTI